MDVDGDPPGEVPPGEVREPPGAPVREHHCGQQIFGYSRRVTAAARATHCYHHCGPEGMDAAIPGDDRWFCSLPCYKAHLLDTPSYAHQTQLQALPTVARQVYGVHAPIKPAPPRTALAMFGGPLSTADFLAAARDPDVEVVRLHGHDVTHATVLEVRRRQSDQEGFRQVFEATTAAAEPHPEGASLFDSLSSEIKNERKDKIVSMQGRGIFKAMGYRRRKPAEAKGEATAGAST